MPLQTHRRWYVTVRAPTDQDLGVWIAEQDAIARDAGYLPFAVGPVNESGDLRSVEVTYEESDVGRAIRKQAEEARMRVRGPTRVLIWLGVVAGALILGYLFTRLRHLPDDVLRVDRVSAPRCAHGAGDGRSPGNGPMATSGSTGRLVIVTSAR